MCGRGLLCVCGAVRDECVGGACCVYVLYAHFSIALLCRFSPCTCIYAYICCICSIYYSFSPLLCVHACMHTLYMYLL